MTADTPSGNGARIHRIAIEGEFTIFTAQSLRDELLTALGQNCEVEVDLARVCELDSAGLQLMIAAKREAAARSTALRFVGHSPTIMDTLDLCDLSAYFGDPVLIPRA